MNGKNDDIDVKKNIEQEIQLEKIAKIVEENIHFVDEDMPAYDGYDIPEIEEDVHIKEGVYINEGNRKDISPKQKKESNKEKKVESDKEVSSTEQTVINRVEKEPYYLKEVIGGEVLKRRYTTVELIMGIAVISIICSSGIGVLGELPDFLAFSKWNGISFGDLGLPLLLASFCFMIPTEVELDIKRKKSFKEICIKKLKVGIILFVIGVLINLIGAWNFNSFRIMGILQMIAVVYMVGSLLYVLFRRFNFKILVIAVFLTAIGLACLAGYYFASVNFGDTAKNCLAYFVDSKVMPGHIGDFERYGIMSTVSALCGGCLAMAAGSFLCNRRVENRDKSNKILIMGMFFVIIALLMERNCPYNASVMSPSFVMIVLGGYCVVFAALFGIFDLNRSKASHLVSRPFVVMGASPVFVIVLNEFIKNTLFKINVYSVARGCGLRLDEWLVVDILSAVFGSGSRMIGFLVIYILLIFVLMLYLYSKKIYIRFK